MLVDIFLAALLLLYSYLVFELIDQILENPRLRRVWRIPVGALDMLVGLFLIQAFQPSSLTAYLIVTLVFCVNFALLYQDSLAGVLLCALACSLHLMCLRSIITAIFALVNNLSLYQVIDSPPLFAASTAITLLVLCVCILAVLRFIPLKKVKIINQHGEQVWFLIGWLAVFNFYLLVNSVVYSSPDIHSQLLVNQLVAPIVILTGLYIVLFFSVTTVKLLGYKERSEELVQRMDTQKRYRDSMLKDSLVTYEFNCTQNQMLAGFEQYAEQLGDQINNYSAMVEEVAPALIHPDDLTQYLAYASRVNVLACFESGITESAIDYRRMDSCGNYRWVRCVTNLVQDPQSNDIIGFTYIKDIDEQKRTELELQFNAERDSLTHLYNKGMTQKLIDEYIVAARALSAGALFIIDVDDFKSVNDQLGHTSGDTVLRELSAKLQQAFRENDVVGRVGGDEFIAFMKGAYDEQVVRRKAAELCQVLQGVCSSDTQQHSVSVSVGVAMAPRDGRSFQKLYKNADTALYEAKGAGKNTYSLYSGKLFEGYSHDNTKGVN